MNLLCTFSTFSRHTFSPLFFVLLITIIGVERHFVECFSSLAFPRDTIHTSRIKINMNSKDESPGHKPMKIVIAGAGVIGTSTAYYLAKNHASEISSITIVDPSGKIAPAASGKAGGFLALDWNDYAPTGPLTRRSFDLHQEISDELGADNIMYRRLTCASISVHESRQQRRPSGKKLEGLEWVGDSVKDGGELVTDVIGFRALGDESTIAQVHPKLLCDAMWDKVQQDKTIQTTLIKAKVVEALSSKEMDTLLGAQLSDGSTLEADAVLFACGPWTEYGNCMLGVKYHSAIIPTRPRILNQSVFFDGFGDPEVYPRPDGTAYCTGFPDPAIRVTEAPGEEAVRREAIQKIINAVRDASGGVNGALGNEPELEQSCYLPMTPDGLPMMGPSGVMEGCFVAAGHGCWGILLGPATGETMASLMVTGLGTPYVNLSPFSPNRFTS